MEKDIKAQILDETFEILSFSIKEIAQAGLAAGCQDEIYKYYGGIYDSHAREIEVSRRANNAGWKGALATVEETGRKAARAAVAAAGGAKPEITAAQFKQAAEEARLEKNAIAAAKDAGPSDWCG